MTPLFNLALPRLRSKTGAERHEVSERLQSDVTALFDQFRNPLLRYLLTFGLSLADGEEVLQEVFLSLFQQLDRGRRISDPRSWLFRVAHNQALKKRYHARRGVEVQEDVNDGSIPIDPYPNPEERMANNQKRDRISAVVRALPEQDRLCLSLRAEGLRYSEIAAILNISPAAISVSLSRSLARIARSTEHRYT